MHYVHSFKIMNLESRISIFNIHNFRKKSLNTYKYLKVFSKILILQTKLKQMKNSTGKNDSKF